MSFLSNTEYKLTEYAAETMVYFEKHKLIEIVKVRQHSIWNNILNQISLIKQKILVECSLERPENPQEWIGKNLKRIAQEIYEDCLNGGENNCIKPLKMSSKYLYRIVIFGRPGSGKKTQANYLQKQFNLVKSKYYDPKMQEFKFVMSYFLIKLMLKH